MHTEIDKVANDARSFKGRYVKVLEKAQQEKVRKADYEQLLRELEVEKI